MSRYFSWMDKDHYSLASNFRTCDKQGNTLDYFTTYLTQDAIVNDKQGEGKTYLYIEKNDVTEDEKLLGFFTLRSSSLIVRGDDLRAYYGQPALEIYELAVHKDYQGQGIGSKLIKEIFAKACELNENYLGIKHIVVCAKESAVPFYEKSFFRRIDDIVPRSYDNNNCVAMSVRLQTKT